MTTTELDLAGKIVAVTGGTGTIGSAIVQRLLDTDVAQIRVYSRDESKQFDLNRRLGNDDRLRFLIGDTRDFPRLRRALEGVDYIFHTAAMKHVFACEYNPFEAVQTNIIGTQNVIEAAVDRNVSRVLFASSDKAVSPTSTMGTSKLMAEKLITAGNYWRGSHPTIFTSVRFGNVVGSRGSVLPLFLEQIAAGGPVTLTDRRMTRFIMSIERAVDLMFGAMAIAHGGEVFVLKMPALRIEDLASVLREHISPLHGHDIEDIVIEEIGMQAGEKTAEELVADEELSRCLETEEMYIVLPQASSLTQRDLTYPNAHPVSATSTRSDAVEPMSRDELEELLVEWKVLSPA
jgi:UDP-N-acetylglucosamine 4,6-dehydratase/5-epimerase